MLFVVAIGLMFWAVPKISLTEVLAVAGDAFPRRDSTLIKQLHGGR